MIAVFVLLTIIGVVVWLFAKSDRNERLKEKQYRERISVSKINNQKKQEINVKANDFNTEDKLTKEEQEKRHLDYNLQLQRENKQKRLQRDLLPCIRSFVKTHISQEHYPRVINCNEEMITALQLIIQQEHNINITFTELEKLVKCEFEQQNEDLFKRLFLAHNPELLLDNEDYSLEANFWLRAYLKTFGNNYDYLESFLTLLDKEDLYHSIFHDLEYSVTYEEREQGYRELTNQDYDPDCEYNWEQDTLSRLVVLLNRCNKEINIENLATNYKEAMNSGRFIGHTQISIQEIDNMGGLEFERFLTTLFKEMGYKVELTKASGDQGADLIAEKAGEKIVIQAKCYSQAVSNKAIQEVVASKTHYKCSRAMVITNNYFTKSAIELALSNNVGLWDRAKLEEAIQGKMLYLS